MSNRIALLVLLTACAGTMPPPPYHVYFRESADDALVLDTYESVDDWNTHLRGEWLIMHAPGERPPAGACNVVSVGREGKQASPTAMATTERDACGVELRILPIASPTTVRHELGHALGLPDHAGGIMNYEAGRTITDQNAADVRAYWNM